MPNYQLGDTEKAPFTLTELDGASNPATPQPGDVVSVVSADTDSATVVMDPTPVAGSVASGWVVGGKKLQTDVQITASVSHTDGSPALTVTDLIDIVGGKASSISLGLGAPVSQ